MGIAELILAGKELGIFQFYIPFMVMFAILYGLLNKTKIFGEEKKAKTINLIISIGISLFLMQYALAAPLANFFAQFTGSIFAILIGILGFLMVTYLLLALVGGKLPEPEKYVKYLVLTGIILSVAAFISSGGAVIFPGISISNFPQTLPSVGGLSSGDIAIILMIIFAIIVIYWLTKGEEGKKIEYVGVPIRT